VSLPYYTMYPKDFDTDKYVRAMEDCQLGLFLRCLNHSWINNGLPSDPDEIRRSFRDTPEAFAQKWPRVEPCFPIAEDGMRRNPRQEKERAKSEALYEQRKTAGKNSAEKRSSARSTTVPTPVERALERESNEASGSGSYSVVEVVSSGESAERGIEPSVEPILAELDEIYRLAGAPIPEKHKQIAAQLLISISPEKRARVPAYCKWALWSGKWPNPAKTKALVNVLRDGDWDVEPTARTLPDALQSRPPSKAQQAQDIAAARVLARHGVAL
jgi:hypothetical protein